MSRRGAALDGVPHRVVAIGRVVATIAGFWLLAGSTIPAQVLTFEDVNPDSSNNGNPNAASGGRVNGIAIDPNSPLVMYAASEWGGIYKSIDGGTTWARLNGHRPTVTWDVKVDPSNSNKIYATSFYDGRLPSLSGINVSSDGGVTWTHPPTAVPPAGFCANPADRTELTAFGIAIDPGDNAKVYIGTSCGLAISTNSGATWSFTAPGGAPGASRIWSVVAAPDGSSVDTCGDRGHFYLDSGGGWAGGSGLPSGLCSIAASPYGASNFNLFATVGNRIYEAEDGQTWTETRTNPLPQGRIPFLKTNKRSLAPAGRKFDLWFGDVSLYRVECDTDAAGPNCGAGNSPPWSPQVLVCSVTTTTPCATGADCPSGESCKNAGYTSAAGGHDDMGSIAFHPSAANDACPLLMSSDGGVYVNTLTTSPACHTPAWQAPTTTPHGLWPWDLSGADLSGNDDDHLFVANQDNGVFGTTNAGAAEPTWSSDTCCDVEDTVASEFGSGSVIYLAGFYSPGRGFRYFKKNADFSGGGEINYPSGGLQPAFTFTDSLARWGDKKYAMLTNDCTVGSGGCSGADGGLFITQDIGAVPIVWTELGNATEPQNFGNCLTYPPTTCTGLPTDCGGNPCWVASPCAVYSPRDASTFYEQVGACSSDSGATTDTMWKFTGTIPGGAWTRINLPNGEGFGAFAVDPNNGNRLLAVGLSPTDATVYLSTNGGASWSALADLNSQMRGGGDFPIVNQRGPTNGTGMNGYFQPSLLGFDPFDSSNLIAGGRDSGIFLSQNSGTSWNLVTDPRNSHTSGIPHLPRPRHAYFSEADHDKSIYVASQGRGVWRLGICAADAYESDDVSAPFIISGVPQERSICGTGNEDSAYFILSENSVVTIETSGPSGDTTLTLLDVNGAQIAFDDDSGAGTFSRIVRSCATGSVLPAGTYFVKVKEFEANDTIPSYQLRVDIAPCCGNGAVDPGEGCDDGNRGNGDCCSEACTSDAPGTACEDGSGCTLNDTCGAAVSQSFDGVTAPALPSGWATSGTGTLWATTAAGSDTPPNAAGTDDPSTVTDKVLDSQVIGVSSSAVATFRNRYDLETGFDGGVLEIKIGAGAFQDIVAAGGSFIGGGYNSTISTCCGNPLGGRQAWSGNSGGFVTTTVNLPPAAVGQNVVLRWRLASDSSQAGVGQRIDTLSVTGGGQIGCRPGTSITVPAEAGPILASDKVNFAFPPLAGATGYSALRGLVGALPVGPGGGDEFCVDIPSSAFPDPQNPPTGSSYWYLARGKNTCGSGTFGQQSNGTTRSTSSCP